MNPVADSWWVYIIETRGGKLYTGVAVDIERRFAEHRAGGARGAKFFRSDPALQIVYRCCMPGRSEALQQEARIKKMSRAQKQLLINGAQ